MKKIILILFTIIIFQFTSSAQSDVPCGSGGWGGSSGAEELTVGTSCSYTNGEITGGFMGGNTDSGEGDPGCGNYNGGPDVWYQFTVPASGSVLITTQAGSLNDMAMALYSGPDCNNLSQFNCNDNGGNSTMPEIDAYGLTPGDTIWIRLWDYAGDETGDFDICIVEETCSDGIWNQGEEGIDCGGSCTECTGDICEHSLPFCTGTTYNFPLQTDNGSAVSGPDYDCLYTQPNPVWYYLQISQAGNIDIHIESTPGQHDVDFICWGPFDHVECDASDLTGSYVVDCSYSTSYAEDCNIPNAQVDEYYVLLITNYSNATTDVEFSQTGGTGATDCSIVNPPNCSIDAGQDQTICLGNSADLYANVSVDAGSSYTLDWSPTGTSTGQNSVSVTPSSTTTYTVTLNTDNGCTATDDVTVNTVELLIDQIVVTNENCGFADGTATVTMQNGQTPYTFDIGSQNNSDGNFTGLTANTYQLTVTDNMGCEDIDQFTIVDPGSITASFTASDTELCVDSAYFNFTNTGFSNVNATYDWSFQSAVTSSANTENVNGIQWVTASQFTVSQTITYGSCQDVATMQITVNPLPEITSIDVINNLCYGDCSGSLTANVSGNSPFNYIWDNGGSSQNINNLCQGDYYLTVIDANACQITSSASVSEPSDPVNISDISTTDVSCYGYSDGSINVSVIGGIGPYTFTIGSNSNNTGNFENLQANTYQISLSDNNSCTVDTSVIINQPDELTITNITKTDILCYGESSGTAQINVDGGTQSYTYYLDSISSTSNTFTGLGQGLHSVLVVDAHSCTANSSVEINEPNKLILSALNEYNICNGSSIDLTTSLSGGIMPYSYIWNTNATTISINVSPTDTTVYTVQASDANNCVSDLLTITVNPTVPVSIDAYANNDKVCPGEPVLISSNIFYGIAPYTIYINDVVNSLPIIVYPNNSELYYYVKIVDACGSVAYDTVKIETYSIPVIDFTSDITQGCPPLEVNFNHNLTGIASYNWNFGDVYSSNTNKPSHVYKKSGIFSVSLSIITDEGCSAQQTIQQMINVYSVPDSRFITSPDIVSFVDPVISFNNISEDNDINIWTFGDGDSSQTVSPIHKYRDVGDYFVSLVTINNYGCADTSMQKVRVREELTLYIPTAFSPDGDGINEEFKIAGSGIDLDKFNLKVYNRWGEIIFETNDFYFSWDGTVDRKKVQAGVYRWTVQYVDFYGKSYAKTGNVNVIR